MTTDELVDEIFGRYRERIERGEVVEVEDLLRAHPDLAVALRERFAAARLLDRDGARGRARRLDDPAALPVGSTLGPYRIESVLGVGGMGTVYRASVGSATDGVEAGSHVAVKVFHPHLAARERFPARFLREGALGRRVRHPNVVRTVDAEEVVKAGRTVRFLVMEHVEGRTLRQMLAELGRLPEELCRHVGREVARGLAAIHAAGAVHRDLKPENVIVTDDHVVKVMDLGVAHVDDVGTLSESGVFIGSLRYGAPEQFARSSDVDARADLHALGLLLYELATGVHPFAGEEIRDVVRQVLDVRPRRCGELAPQVSAFLEELVAQLLEKDRAKRPASAVAVAAILEEGEASTWWKERAAAMRRETKRPLRRIRIPRETALYGRDAEITRLRGVFDKAKAGDGQVVLVEGEAGIGKSRLVDEFVGRLAQAGEDVNFLFGSYPPGGAATASGAFSVAYREHLGDDEAAVRAALPQTPLLVPAFAALLRGDVTPEGAEKLTKDSLQAVFVHATRAFAAQRTTIVLIDDLHFAPEEGRALFASLALAVPGHRILLVGCARPAIDEKWVGELAARTQTTRVAIPRLGPKELVHLLRDALKSQRLAEELAGLIAVKSDGNPFFVFELLRGLRDGQFLRQRQDGTWETTQVIRDIQVPSSISELVQARVADLDAHDKNLLDVASCCGFEFDPLVVAATLGTPQIPTLQRLARIEKKDRLVRSAGRRFVFDHHQVQEALYAGMPEPLREAYHAMIAEALEAMHAALGRDPKALDGALSVDLAEHFLKGARGSQGLRYLDTALTHLEKGYLDDAAVGLADRALAAPGLVAGRARCELLLRKSTCLHFLARRREEARALEEAKLLADAAGDPELRARAMAALGGVFVKTSQWDAARDLLEEALALTRETGDRKGEARATALLGNGLHLLGRYAEAQVQYERRLELAREVGERREEVAGTVDLGTLFHNMGRFVEAQAQFEVGLALAREIGDRRREAMAMGSLGIVFNFLGRRAEALAHHERHLALAREIGDRRQEASASGGLGVVFRCLGRYAEAQAHTERRLALSREVGDRGAEANATGSLGVISVALGRYAEGQAQYLKHLALTREIADRAGEAVALGNVGQVRLLLGDVRLAGEALGASLAIAREIGARLTEGYALIGLGSVADEEGETARALTSTTESLGLRRTIGAGDAVVDSLVALGDLRRRAGDADGARAALEEAVSLARELGTKPEEALALAILACLPGGDVGAAEAALAETGERGDVPRVRFLLWQATGDRAHLGAAKHLLDEFLSKNPPEYRASMLANVRVNREIAAAWREQFGGGDPSRPA